MPTKSSLQRIEREKIYHHLCTLSERLSTMWVQALDLEEKLKPYMSWSTIQSHSTILNTNFLKIFREVEMIRLELLKLGEHNER